MTKTAYVDPDVERAKWVLERSAEGIVKARELAVGYAAAGLESTEAPEDQGIRPCR